MQKLSPWPLLAVAFVCIVLGILVSQTVWKTGGSILVGVGVICAVAARVVNGR
jgi:hypothetical protein